MPWCITLMTWPCHCDDTGANSTNSMDEPASGRFYATFVRIPGLRRLQPKSVLLVSRMAREQGSASKDHRALSASKDHRALSASKDYRAVPYGVSSLTSQSMSQCFPCSTRLQAGPCVNRKEKHLVQFGSRTVRICSSILSDRAQLLTMSFIFGSR